MTTNIHTLTGKNSGPKTVILGSVHGNETMGKKIIDQLLVDLKSNDIAGELILIFGNPKAYEQSVRFIDHDMNRLLGEKKNSLQDTPDTLKDSYEKTRLNEILPHLTDVDYLLDIHSTIQPSVPFVFCEDTPEHKKIASIFATDYVVSPEAKKDIPEMRDCFDNYADRQGGIGITYEAGQIGNEENFAEVYEKILKFLEAIGILEKFVETKYFLSPTNTKNNQKTNDDLSLPNQKNLTIYQAIIPQSNDFKFMCEERTFLPLKKDTLIAHDGEQKIFAPQDSYLIFPKKNPLQSDIAGYLAVNR
jgi:succinylglutamate desuccinylase